MAKKTFEYIWHFLRENNCEGLDNVTDEIRCTICRKILIDPCSGCCGCRYCLACITGYLNGEQKFCPGNASDCKEELLDLCNLGHPDYPTSQKISKLIVKCPRDGCEWRCELRELEAHERVCKSSETVNCPYGNIGCQESRLTNDMMNVHLVDQNELHAQLLVECIDTLRNENESMKRDLADMRAQGQEQQAARFKLEMTNEQQDKKIENLRQEMIQNNKSIMEENKSIKKEMESMKEENNSLKSELEQIQGGDWRFGASMGDRDNKSDSLKQPFQLLKNNQSMRRENKSINMRNESIRKLSTLPAERIDYYTYREPDRFDYSR